MSLLASRRTKTIRIVKAPPPFPFDSFIVERLNPLADIITKQFASRFYLNPVDRQTDLNSEPTARLCGNRVLLYRKDTDLEQTDSGLWTRDIYGQGSILFKVLAVGPGAWVRHKLKKNRWAWQWIEPEVERGDIVISTHWTKASEHQDWHQPRSLDNQGGTGRVIVDARFLEVKWKLEPLKQK